MKKLITKITFVQKVQLFVSAMLVAYTQAMSQNMPEVTANGKNVGSWFSNNWLWITIFVIVLLAILLMGSNRRRTTTTTIVKDESGNIEKRTTTTEVDE